MAVYIDVTDKKGVYYKWMNGSSIGIPTSDVISADKIKSFTVNTHKPSDYEYDRENPVDSYLVMLSIITDTGLVMGINATEIPNDTSYMANIVKTTDAYTEYGNRLFDLMHTITAVSGDVHIKIDMGDDIISSLTEPNIPEITDVEFYMDIKATTISTTNTSGSIITETRSVTVRK